MYKVTFKPESSFTSELHSSTLFGAMCWAIATLYGEDVLKENVLENTDPESLAISDAFPEGWICTPLFNKEDADTITNEAGDKSATKFNTYKIEHCMIDRELGTSKHHWFENQHFTKENLVVYVVSNIFSTDELTEILKFAFENGIGSRKSTGKGRFQIVGNIEEINSADIAEMVIPEWEDETYMVLGDYIPNESDEVDGSYSIRVINGRTVDGTSKEPVYVVNAGGVFRGNIETEAIGRLEKDVNTGTYTGGRAIVIQIA